jgi:hypothetical protein
MTKGETMPERICARCGCGTESGWQYPSCADFDTAEERWEAHRIWCTKTSLELCQFCEPELMAELEVVQ